MLQSAGMFVRRDYPGVSARDPDSQQLPEGLFLLFSVVRKVRVFFSF